MGPDGGPVGHELFLGPTLPVVLGPPGAIAVELPDRLLIARYRDGTLRPLPDTTGKTAAFPVALTGPSAASAKEVNAYWTDRGRLVRRTVGPDGSTGPLEVLAQDAAEGYAIAAARAGGAKPHDVVVYVDRQAREQGERGARLWIDGQGSRPLSSEAGGTTSAAIAAVGPRELVVLTLDGRAGMSSIHAVRVTLGPQGESTVGEDRVVYVAGDVQWHTRLVATAVVSRPIALVPLAKDITAFGLLSLLVPARKGEAKAAWVDYPNGLDPAPLATAKLCGRTYVAFARPEGAAPSSPQLVELARVQADGRVLDVRTITSAPRVVHLALGAAPAAAHNGKGSQDSPGGGWLAYGTDEGLWARPIRCD